MTVYDYYYMYYMYDWYLVFWVDYYLTESKFGGGDDVIEFRCDFAGNG